MGELPNRFSWSFSRHVLFEDCPRSYYLSYYGAWNGWSRGAPPRTRELYTQKNLTTAAMWVGTVVHEVAEGALQALQQGQQPWVERAVELALGRARGDIEASRQGRYRQDPKRTPGFQEHYYPGAEPDWDAELAEIQRQIHTLFDHPVFRRMLEVPERILEVELLRQHTIAEVPVWVRLDALMAGDEGRVVVVDWKTGRDHDEGEIGRQLGVYGIYVSERRGLPVEQVQALHVNLRYNTWTAHPIDPATLDLTRALVRRSADAMLERLVDRERNVAREEDFPLLPAGDARCARCRFRGDCGRA